MTPPPFGIYLHWPYCRAKCPYCDFNVHLKSAASPSEEKIASWLIQEISGLRAAIGAREAASVYFGGGTPSLMPPRLIGLVLEAIERHFSMAADCEISLEINPEDASPAFLRDLRAAGITRLSLGAQSLRDEKLRFLKRRHDSRQIRKAMSQAARFFDDLSVDLIYAVPHETGASWRAELEEALGFLKEPRRAHLSLYQLTIEKGTPFFRAQKSGRLAMPSPARQAALYQMTQDLCERAGFPAYEISSHGRGVLSRSRHNLLYWRYGEYAGLGAGAHGRLILGGRRFATETPRQPRLWGQTVETRGRGWSMTPLSPLQTAEERLMMGLRLAEGVPRQSLPEAETPRFQEEEGFLRKKGLLTKSGTHIRATGRGRLLMETITTALSLALSSPPSSPSLPKD